MRILFKLTTRSRPERAYDVLQSIWQNVSTPDFDILISVDREDDTLSRLTNLLSQSKMKYTMVSGDSDGKIDAINRDVPLSGWDVLVNVSDDTKFVKKGFDEDIRQAFTEHFPDLDGVLHYPDGNRKDLLTVSIIGHEYYLRDQYIYHPEYKSLWCDNEAMEVAQIRGKYKFVDVQLFEHLHWAYGKAGIDNQYQEQNGYFSRDKDVFHSRKIRNFDL